MVAIRIIDGEGRLETLLAPSGSDLMSTLRGAGLVEAICGGGASCGTCAVRVEAAWREVLMPPDAPEAMMLEAFEMIGEGARLSCQIIVDERLDGLTLRLLAP